MRQLPARVVPVVLLAAGALVATSGPATAAGTTPTASASPAVSSSPTGSPSPTASPSPSASPVVPPRPTPGSSTASPKPVPGSPTASPEPAPTAPGTASPSASVPVSRAATSSGTSALAVSVTADPAPVTRSGARLTYTVTVTNTGDQSLRDVVTTAVARDLGRLSCAPVAQGATLAARASTVCTGSRPSGPADLRNPAPAVTATAVGIRPDGTGVSASATVRTPASTPPPKVTDDTAVILFGTESVILPGSSNDTPAEPGGPAIDRSASFFPDGITTTGQRGNSEATSFHGSWQALEDGTVKFLDPGGGTSWPGGWTDSIRYTTVDAAGRSTTGTLTVTMRPGPVARDDEATTEQGDPVVVHPLANDSPGNVLKGAKATLLPSSLRFTPEQSLGSEPTGDAVVSADGKTMTIPYRGTFTIVDDTIRYQPAPTFFYDLTVTYSVTDSALNTATAHVRFSVAYMDPKLSDDSADTTFGRSVTLPGVRNDTPTVPAHTLRFAGFLDSGHTIHGSTLTTPEGLWSLDYQGDVVFQPADGFSGPARAEYAADEVTAAGLVLAMPGPYLDVWQGRHIARLAVTVHSGPSASPLVLSTPHDTRRTIDPTSSAKPGVHADSTLGHFVPARTVLPTYGQPAGSRVYDGGRTLILATGGKVTVSASNGQLAYTPAPGYVGTPGTVLYSLEDDTTGPDGSGEVVTGRLTLLATGGAPVATDDQATALPGRPVRLAAGTDDDAGAPGAATVDLPAADQPAGSRVSDDGRTLTVAGQGTWAVGSDGSVTFTPVPGFADGADVVTYRLRSSAGTATAHLAVTVLRGPAAQPDQVTLPELFPSYVDPIADDVPGRDADGTLGSIDRSTLRFPATGQPAGATVSTSGTDLNVPKGGGLPSFSASVYAKTGAVSVNAGDQSFRGTSPAIRYTVQAVTRDAAGAEVRTTISSTFRVRFTGSDAVATDDSATVASGETATLPATMNDIPSAAGSYFGGLTFPEDQLADLPPGSTTGRVCYGEPEEGCPYSDLYVRVPSQGYWQTTYEGVVTFEPDRGFQGTTTPVRYTVGDSQGAAEGTLTVTVLPPGVVRPDSVSTPQGVPVTVDLLANDTPARAPDGTVVQQVEPDGYPFGYFEGEPAGSVIVDDSNFRTLEVPGEGTYRVEYGTARVTFTPDPALRGWTTPVYVRLRGPVNDPDTRVLTKLRVHVDPVDPSAATDEVSTTAGAPVQVPVLANDAPGTGARPLVATSLRLRTTPGLPAGSAVTSNGQALTVAGRGTFVVVGNGTLWFFPLAGTSGALPPVRYDVADANGTRALSTVTVRVAA